jgi:hypothetical protein
MEKFVDQVIGNNQVKLDFMWGHLLTKVGFPFLQVFSSYLLMQLFNRARYWQTPKARSGVNSKRRRPPASHVVDSTRPAVSNIFGKGFLQPRDTQSLRSNAERKISNSRGQLSSILRSKSQQLGK